MTFDAHMMTDLLPITSQFAQVPVENWGDTVEPQAQTILKAGDALVSAWENQTLAEGDYATARQFLYDCSHYLAHRPEHHRPNWLEMGASLAQDDEARAWFWACLGGLNIHWGAYRKALGYYGDALTIYHAQQNVAREGRMLSGMGEAWMIVGELQKSLSHYEQAIALLEQADSPKNMVDALNGIGALWVRLNKREKGQELVQRALTLSREIGYKAGEGTSLNNGAIQMTDKSQSLQMMEQALGLHQQLGHKPCESTVLLNMALCYRALKAPHKGIQPVEGALKIAYELQNIHKQALAYNVMSALLKDMRKYKEALAYSEQAFALAYEVGVHTTQIDVLMVMAQIYKTMFNYEKSLAMFEQALMIANKTEHVDLQIAIISHIIHLLNLQRKPQEHLAWGDKMLAVAEKTGEADIMALAYSLYAKPLLKAKRFDEAIAYAEKALNTLEKNGLTHDFAGCGQEVHQKHIKRLYGRRDGWFYKLFPFLL